MDDLPDTIRLTEAEQAELARRVAEMLADAPPTPPVTDAQIADMAARWDAGETH
jgi:hypothetical protein